MPWVGFDSTVPVFEQAKTVHAFDLAATVIGIMNTRNTVNNTSRIELSIFIFILLNYNKAYEPIVKELIWF
jgi:hypothetical protein